MESIRGVVSRVVYRSDNFHILAIEPDNRDLGWSVTVKGQVLGAIQVVAGASLEFFGDWVQNKKFGRQFSMSGWRPAARDDRDARVILSACLGLPFEVSTALAEKFGRQVFDVLSDDPEAVRKLFASEPEFAEEALRSWALARTSADLTEMFGDHLTAAQMMGIIKTFGAEAREILNANPYELVRVEAFPFDKVDALASKMGISQDDPRRFEGAVLWVLRESARNGHLCVRRGDLASALVDLGRGPGVEAFSGRAGMREELLAAVERLAARKSVRVDPESGVYLPPLYKYERGSAEKLAAFLGPSNLDVDLTTFVETFESAHHLQLSEAQKDAIDKLIRNKVLVLTGLPGTGKTMLVRTFVSLFEGAGISYALMAPTGIAAKRLASVTSREAATVHRTLRFDGAQWGYGEGVRFPVGAVIVDEMSMIDQELLYRILDALDESTVLVLVGDDAQLPSVGPGNVLRELVASGSVPTVRLTQIFRQKETSDIVLNAHRINRGEPVQASGPKSDFQLVPIDDEVRILELIVQMAQKLKDRGDNFQILAPKYDGVVGVTGLNEALREQLNPPSDVKTEFAFGDFLVREGDRVMVVQNDYQLNVYNGDMAKLVRVGEATLHIKVYGTSGVDIDRIVEVPKKEAAQKLRLAYAITVHKAQGSEFDTVILPVVRTQGRMLQRNLVYTAVTRARRKVWVLGERGALSKAIANDQVVQRNTGFARAIRRAVAASAGVVSVGGALPAST